ncbi:MAG: Rho termination factor N-terminal domain-containing protein [Gemmatimonadales bacterium]
MARKGNNPDKMDADKDTASKRRYQSPQTPPQPPRASSRRGGAQEADRLAEDGQDIETQDLDTEDLDEDRIAGRGTSQEYGEGRRQGRGLVEDSEQDTRGRGQDWQDEGDEDGIAGRYAGRGGDFDLQKASRDELNAIAVELDIEDYETMNREELVMEIRERS